MTDIQLQDTGLRELDIFIETLGNLEHDPEALSQLRETSQTLATLDSAPTRQHATNALADAATRRWVPSALRAVGLDHLAEDIEQAQNPEQAAYRIAEIHESDLPPVKDRGPFDALQYASRAAEAAYHAATDSKRTAVAAARALYYSQQAVAASEHQQGIAHEANLAKEATSISLSATGVHQTTGN